MEEWIQFSVEWISGLNPIGIYLAIFAIAYLENVVPPIPGDVLIAFSGFLVASGSIDLVATILISSFGSQLGFASMYGIGYAFEKKIEHLSNSSWFKRIFDGEHLATVFSYMSKHGQWVVLFNRFLAGTRSIISLASGMAKMSVAPTMMNALLSSLVWNGILIFGGFNLASNWKAIMGYLSQYGTVVTIVIIIVGTIIWVRKKKN